MATVIDSLVVEIALDARKLLDENRKVLDEFRKSNQEYRRQADEAESHGRKVFELFSDIKRTAIEMTGLFLGGLGLKEVVQGISNMQLAVNKLSNVFQVSERDAQVWAGIWRQFGGSTEGAIGTLSRLGQALQYFRIHHESPLFGPLNALGVNIAGVKDPSDFLNKVTSAVQRLRGQHRSEDYIRGLLRESGFGDEDINVLTRSPEALRRARDISEKNVQPPSKNWLDLIGASDNLVSAIRKAADTILEPLLPSLTKFANVLAGLVQDHPVAAGAVEAGATVIGARAAWRFGKRLLGRGGAAAAGGEAEAAAPSWLASIGFGALGTSAALAIPLLLGMTSTAGESDDAERRRREGSAKKGRLLGNTRGMSPDLVRRLSGLAADVGDIRLTSGFRTHDEQQALRQNNPSGYPVAAGTSMHELGLAADVKGATPEIDRLLHANAGNYGIVFRVPHDPVHAEALGARAAAAHRSVNVGGSRMNTDKSTKVTVGHVSMNLPGVRDGRRFAGDFADTIGRGTALAGLDSGLVG